jgi:hypothetical protein
MSPVLLVYCFKRLNNHFKYIRTEYYVRISSQCLLQCSGYPRLNAIILNEIAWIRKYLYVTTGSSKLGTFGIQF